MGGKLRLIKSYSRITAGCNKLIFNPNTRDKLTFSKSTLDNTKLTKFQILKLNVSIVQKQANLNEPGTS